MEILLVAGLTRIRSKVAWPGDPLERRPSGLLRLLAAFGVILVGVGLIDLTTRLHRASGLLALHSPQHGENR